MASSDNVFIGDLPAHITKEDCESIFQGYGSITQCRVMAPKAPGAKASALVRFASVEEAQWVVDNLSGNLAEGLEEPIVARFANAPGAKSWGKGEDGGKSSYRSEPYSKGGYGGGWSNDGDAGGRGGKGKGVPGSFRSLYGAVKGAGLLGGGHVPNECQIYVKNLPRDTSDVDLFRLFAPFGAVAPSGAKAMINDDGTCKGFGFVDYVDQLSAQAAIAALNGFAMPDGSSIAVSCKVPGKGKGKGKEQVEFTG